MKKDELIEKLMSTFLEEMDEQVSVLNRDLIRLEKQSAETAEHKALLRSIFRTVHSLKGASRSVDMNVIERACHSMEELFSLERDGLNILSPAVFSLLFALADLLSEAGLRLRKKQDPDWNKFEPLIKQLDLCLDTQSQVELLVPDCMKNAGTHLAVANMDPEIIDNSARSSSEQNNESSQIEIESSLAKLKATVEKSSDRRMEAAPIVDTCLSMSNISTESNSVKVTSKKLDSLLAQSTELLTSHGRTQTWLDKCYGLQEFVRNWQNQWRAFEEPHNSDSGNSRLVEAAQLTREKIRSLSREMDSLLSSLRSDARALEETARRVDEEIRSLRMRPFSELCVGMERTVRDIASGSNKEVELLLRGGELEIDRAILERLRSPLNHLLRNAVQHGIETMPERLSRGKPASGNITLSACLLGSQVEIRVEDDGRGIDLDRIRAQSRKKGLPEPKDEAECIQMLFQPSFSTSNKVDRISGRGVGLDVVANELLALQGSINVSAQTGQGACFILRVPLTLTKIRALFVKVSNQNYAFPSANIETLLRLDPESVLQMHGQDVVSIQKQFVPLLSLREELNLTLLDRQESQRRLPIVVLRHGNDLKAYIVDEFQFEQEAVVTNLGHRLLNVTNLSGATLMANGEIALIINTAQLLRQKSRTRTLSKKEQTAAAPQKKKLILADDSITTRLLETSILESAGYEVIPASDGVAAWELLNSGGADLVVSDVEMPKMDGFTLTEAIRNSGRWSDLPVVLVTSLSRESDRRRGAELGANAYVTKGDFDQTALLEAIAQLV